MYKKVFLIFAFLWMQLMAAQTYEVGVQLGVSNYIGDIGSSKIIQPEDSGFGIIAKWNRSKRHSFRASFSYIKISSNDVLASGDRRIARSYNFENSVKELSIGLEYTFWEWDLHSSKKQMTPYLFTGFNVINHGDLARNPQDNFRAFDDSWNFAIPMVVGIKANIGTHVVFSLELGARYTFTDNLDGSDPKNLNINSIPGADNINLSFGNPNNNDWYFFNAISLTYTFGRRPCYCIF